MKEPVYCAETQTVTNNQTSSCEVKWVVTDDIYVKQGDVSLNTLNVSTDTENTLNTLTTEEDENNKLFGISTAYTIYAVPKEKTQIEDALSEISKLEQNKRTGIASVIDIGIKKEVYNNDTENMESVSFVDETVKNIKIRMPIPDDLRNSKRSFHIVREHNGILSVLENISSDQAYVEFYTDKFSMYYLGYIDDVTAISNEKVYFASVSKEYANGSIIKPEDILINCADKIEWSDGIIETKNIEPANGEISIISGHTINAGDNTVRISFTAIDGSIHTFTINVKGYNETNNTDTTDKTNDYSETNDSEEEEYKIEYPKQNNNKVVTPVTPVDIKTNNENDKNDKPKTDPKINTDKPSSDAKEYVFSEDSKKEDIEKMSDDIGTPEDGVTFIPSKPDNTQTDNSNNYIPIFIGLIIALAVIIILIIVIIKKRKKK